MAGLVPWRSLLIAAAAAKLLFSLFSASVDLHTLSQDDLGVIALLPGFSK